MEEVWRDVPGFEGKYQISISTKEGKCRNLDYCGNGETHELSNNIRKYIFWSLNGRTQQAARWIAITYPELVQNEYFEGAVIDHIDTDCLNNNPSNLRWVTQKDNVNNPLTKKKMSDSAKIKVFTEKHRKNMSKSRKGIFVNYPKYSKPVLQYTKDGVFVSEYPSMAEAHRITGVRQTDICAVCSGRVYKGRNHNTAGGYIWKYKGKEAV